MRHLQFKINPIILNRGILAWLPVLAVRRFTCLELGLQGIKIQLRNINLKMMPLVEG